MATIKLPIVFHVYCSIDSKPHRFAVMCFFLSILHNYFRVTVGSRTSNSQHYVTNVVLFFLLLGDIHFCYTIYYNLSFVLLSAYFHKKYISSIHLFTYCLTDSIPQGQYGIVSVGTLSIIICSSSKADLIQ